jgi:hypothetical protein
MMSGPETADHNERPTPDEPGIAHKQIRKDEYEVGYGRPPVDTRFKKGKSGNPRGRPVGRINGKTMITRILSEKVPVRVGTKSRSMSKLEAMFQAHTNLAIKGDVRSFNIVAGHVARMGVFVDTTSETLTPSPEQDIAILDDYDRRRASKGDAADHVEQR